MLSIKTRILLVLSAVLLSATLAYGGIFYLEQEQTLLQGIDGKLLVAAESVRALLGPDYHNAIESESSVAPQSYGATVEVLTDLCRRLGLQYLWSVIEIQGKVRFTSATSPSKQTAQKDYAAFFEEHSNPEAFAEAFAAMRTTYSSFRNKWGEGRMVLVPYYDAFGRKHCFGASISTADVRRAAWRNAAQSFYITASLFVLAVVFSAAVAKTLSAPIEQLTQTAERIAQGNLDQEAHIRGSSELVSLGKSITRMAAAIREQLARLQNSRNELRSTLNSIADAVISTDADGRIISMNPVAEKLTGCSEESGRGQCVTDVLRLFDADAHRFARPSGAHCPWKPENGSWYVTGASGENRRVEYRVCQRLDEEHQAGTVFVFRDVTDSFAADEERKRLALIVESTSDLIATTAGDGRISYINPAGLRLLGWETLPAAANVRHCHPPEVSEHVFKDLMPAAAQSGIWTGENVFLHTSGQEIPVSQVLMAHNSEGGELYFSTIARDLSEQKRAEKERQALESQLRHSQKLELLGTLSGGIAHDFNNLLTPILGYVDLLLLDAPQDDELREMLELIRHGAQRGAELVQQILYFSGRSEPKRSLVYAQSTIKEALKLLRPSVPSSIVVETELDERCPKLFIDPVQLHQIIMNLATNASRAISPAGGKIVISLHPVQRTEAGYARGAGDADSTHLCLAVSDTGCGIDEAAKERLFEPFFTTRRAAGGSGLGLSVVHGIVRDHGGEIAVESTVGKGSRFSVYLPLAAHAPDQAHAERLEMPAGRGNIMVVDDEPTIRALLKRTLERLGYSVTAYSSGETALAEADKSSLDLVITDQTMPNMSGLELAKRLRLNGFHVPVLLMSGYSEQSAAQSLGQSGIIGYMHKPIRLQMLATTVASALDKQPA